MTFYGIQVRPYYRRRARPFVTLVTTLALIAAATWSVVFTTASGASGVPECPAPPSGELPGEVLSPDALDEVSPAPPAATRVRVLNAGGQRGQANLVAAQLGDLGFAEAGEPANDALFPEGDMECAGQLRFGTAGEAGAATLALVLPGMELVRDGRSDDSVDVVLGTGFTNVRPQRVVRDLLDQLSGGGTDGSENAAPEAGGAAPAPVVDPELLAQARERRC